MAEIGEWAKAAVGGRHGPDVGASVVDERQREPFAIGRDHRVHHQPEWDTARWYAGQHPRGAVLRTRRANLVIGETRSCEQLDQPVQGRSVVADCRGEWL